MTKEEARHWFITVLIDIGLVLITIWICVNYTNKKVNSIDPKLDQIIEMLKDD